MISKLCDIFDVNIRCWVKLKVAKEWNMADIAPADPEEDFDVMYGIKVWPSNKAVEALPKDGSASEPDTMSIRSGSIIPLALCVSCNGTIAS
jgi:hypothetical protein